MLDKPRKRVNRKGNLPLLNEILDNVSEGVTVVDREWDIIYVNQRAVLDAGFKSADLIGRNLWKIFPQILGTSVEENYRKGMAEQKVRHFEIRGVLNNLLHGITIYPLSEGIALCWHDITARKKSEEENQKLLEALKIHQVELEAQSEELRRTQQEAQMSRDEYLDLFDSAPLGYLILKKDGTIFNANLTAASLLGTQKNKLIHSRFTKFIEPESQDVFYLHLNQTFKATTPQVIEIRMHRQDKSVFHARLECVAVRSEGTPDRIRASLSDITKNKEAEAELRKSEEKFRQLYYSLSEGAARHEVIYDDSGKAVDYVISDVNPAYESITGLKKETIVGKKASQGYGTGEPPYLDIYSKVAASGEPTSFETYFPPMDKHFRISVYSPEKGKFATIFSDITARKKAEADLLRVNRELRAISDCKQAIVHANDEEALYKDICRIMCEVVGYRMAWVGLVEHDEVKSIRPVAWFGNNHGYLAKAKITWDDTELGHGPTGTAARTGKTDVCQDFTSEPKVAPWKEEGLKRGFRSSIALPLFDNQRNVFGVFTLYATEPNGFTPAEINLLEELASTLAFGIAGLRNKHERTRVEEELRRRTLELESANKELEAFSYSVSHDLRAPLRALDGFTQAVIEEYGDKLDETAKGYLERVRLASQKMSELINAMLDLSRIARVEMYEARVNLSELARSFAEELKASDPERQIKIIIAPNMWVKGDKALLQILLNNLLRNAWKFTGNSPIARIEMGTTEKNGEKVYFIKDNGVGFNMKYADKLFQPFQRLHSSKEFPGTGIGLATVQRVVHRHGGRIWAESEPGHGAVFHFTLN